MTTSKTGFTIVTDNRTLKMLADAGKVIWPVMINNSKGIKFKYVNDVEDVGDSFEFKNRKFRLKYHSGCFMPYVYEYFN